jgi:AcrR family transcriptional regulator
MDSGSSSNAPPGRRAAGQERRHQRILAAAEQLFATQGFAKTTVEEIASAAGVSKGLLYQHYESKEALLLAIWLRLVEAWTVATQQAKLAGGSVADSIGEAMRLSFEHVRGTPLLRRILAQDPGSLLPDGAAGVKAYSRVYRAHLEPVLAWGVRNGELRADLDIPHTAEFLWMVHLNLTRDLCVDAADADRADTDALVRAAVAVVAGGLRAPARAATKKRSS